jgi:hypothetical protein
MSTPLPDTQAARRAILAALRGTSSDAPLRPPPDLTPLLTPGPTAAAAG